MSPDLITAADRFPLHGGNKKIHEHPRQRAFHEYRRGLPIPAKGGPGVFWKLALVQYLKDRDGPRSPEMQV